VIPATIRRKSAKKKKKTNQQKKVMAKHSQRNQIPSGVAALRVTEMKVKIHPRNPLPNVPKKLSLPRRIHAQDARRRR